MTSKKLGPLQISVPLVPPMMITLLQFIFSTISSIGFQKGENGYFLIHLMILNAISHF